MWPQKEHVRAWNNKNPRGCLNGRSLETRPSWVFSKFKSYHSLFGCQPQWFISIKCLIRTWLNPKNCRYHISHPPIRKWKICVWNERMRVLVELLSPHRNSKYTELQVNHSKSWHLRAGEKLHVNCFKTCSILILTCNPDNDGWLRTRSATSPALLPLMFAVTCH